MQARWLAGLSALASLLLATTALAGNPCVLASGGIGGTGAPAAVASGEEGPGGIGGTGLETAVPGDGFGGTGASANHDSGGIGGTGKTADEGGIGGTGIVGVITGFGSICVGGIEIHYGPATPISSDGRRLDATQLKIGHVVQVRAHGLGDAVRAQSIELVHAVTGPVRAVDARTGRVEVLGQTVRASAAFVAEAQAAARAGHPVLVSGLRNRAGEIVATRMDAAPGLTEFGVIGAVRDVSQGVARIGNLAIKLNTEQARAIRRGQSLEICGSLENGTLRAHSVELKGVDAFKGRVERVVIEGFVKQRHADRILIDDTVLSLDARTRIIDGDDVNADQRVVVAARVVDGKLVAERVERVRVREHGRSGGADGGESSGKDDADASGDSSGHGRGDSEDPDDRDGKDTEAAGSSHGDAGDARSTSRGGRTDDDRDGGETGNTEGARGGLGSTDGINAQGGANSEGDVNTRSGTNAEGVPNDEIEIDTKGTADFAGSKVRSERDSRRETEGREDGDARAENGSRAEGGSRPEGGDRARADKDAARALRDLSRDRQREAARPPRESKPERASGSRSHGGRPDRVRDK